MSGFGLKQGLLRRVYRAAKIEKCPKDEDEEKEEEMEGRTILLVVHHHQRCASYVNRTDIQTDKATRGVFLLWLISISMHRCIPSSSSSFFCWDSLQKKTMVAIFYHIP